MVATATTEARDQVAIDPSSRRRLPTARTAPTARHSPCGGASRIQISLQPSHLPFFLNPNKRTNVPPYPPKAATESVIIILCKGQIP